MLSLILFRRAASDFDGEDELVTTQTTRTPQSPSEFLSKWVSDHSKESSLHHPWSQHTLTGAKTTRFQPVLTVPEPDIPLSGPISAAVVDGQPSGKFTAQSGKW